jgi:hypothetical protein
VTPWVGRRIASLFTTIGEADSYYARADAESETQSHRERLPVAHPKLSLADWTADQDLLDWLDHACR